MCGESGTMRQAMTATMTDGKPSTRKRRRHGVMGLASPTLRMSQARVEANEVASGAAFYFVSEPEENPLHDIKTELPIPIAQRGVVQGMMNMTRHTRHKDGRSECKLISLEEHAKIERDASEPSLAGTEQCSQDDQERVRRGHRLQRGDDAPGEYEHRCVNVRRDYVPEERHPLKADIGHVEGLYCPGVPIFSRRRRLEVDVHAGDARVADIWSSVSIIYVVCSMAFQSQGGMILCWRILTREHALKKPVSYA